MLTIVNTCGPLCTIQPTSTVTTPSFLPLMQSCTPTTVNHTHTHMHTCTHRVAGEHQIRELQRLIDETFQQFALDDSEDDFEDCDNSLGGGADSTHNLVLPSLSSSSVGNLRDVDSDDVIPPLTSSSSLAMGRGTGLMSSASLSGPGFSCSVSTQ